MLSALILVALIQVCCAEFQAVTIPFNIHRGSSVEDSSYGARPYFVKRDTLNLNLVNEQSFYMANISVGSSQQNVGVLVDTGSSDLWIMGANNPYCGGSTTASKNVEAKLRSLDHLNKAYKQNAVAFKEAAHIFKRDDFTPSPVTQAPTTTITDPATVDKDIFSVMNSLVSEVGGGGGWGVSTYTISGGGSGGSGTYDIPTSVSQAEATMNCDIYGTFDPSKSTSYKSNNTDFVIQYGDFTFASGEWAYDDVKLGGVTVENLSFALANESNSTMGVFGIGLAGLETTNAGTLSTTSNAYTYLNFPLKLVADKVIARNIYSLYLDSEDAASGSILFGGVDHSKYTGQLTTVAVINTLKSSGYAQPIRFEITNSQISVASGNSKVSSSSVSTNLYPALLDSGTTLTYLPPAVISSIGKALGGTYSTSVDAYIVKCSLGTQNINITFGFSGVTIQVPLQNFLLQVSSGGIGTSSSSDSSGNCGVGFLSSGANRIILGDSFLRSAYVVYDLDNYQISLAQANLLPGSSNIETVSANGAVPSATTAASYSATYTGGISAATDDASSGSTTTTTSSTNQKSLASTLAFPIMTLLLSFLGSMVISCC